MKKMMIILVSVVCMLIAGCNSSMLEYRNEEVGIMFQYPSSYKVTRDSTTNGDFVFCAADNEYGHRFISVTYANRWTNTAHLIQYGRSEIRENELKNFRNTWQNEDFMRGSVAHTWHGIDGDNVKERIVKLKNGHNAYIADFNGLGYALAHALSKEKSVVKMIGKVVTFYAGGKAYTFVMSGRKEYDKDDFEAVIDSIQVF